MPIIVYVFNIILILLFVWLSFLRHYITDRRNAKNNIKPTSILRKHISECSLIELQTAYDTFTSMYRFDLRNRSIMRRKLLKSALIYRARVESKKGGLNK